MIRLPWQRWRRAERLADEAEHRLEDARVEHQKAKKLADEARALRSTNGFAEAIRSAMGVH